MALKPKSEQVLQVAAVIEADLNQRHGPKLHGKALVEILGYSSSAALRQAVLKGRVTVPLFTPEKRRGRWALTREVALWLAEQRFQETAPK